MKMKFNILIFILLIMLTPFVFAQEQNEYVQRFMDLWEEIHDPNNGYLSADGVPYHSIETLIVEAPDYGHETTSEAFSYWIWLEAMYGRITGDWSYLNNAWAKMEQVIIPTHSLQPTNSTYNPNSPATYASEHPLPSGYPSQLNSSVPVGQDPISDELSSTYGTDDVYGMHWLLDCDNFYGYGNMGDGVSTPSYINTFQRGEQESCWETVPHPSWEEFNWGGPNGFLDLFTGDASYSKQWRYTNAPDADARAVQALYWAYKWAEKQELNPLNELPIDKAKKMGDYLRLCLFDKYFKPIGCQSESAQGATGRDSAHFLLSWYYAWGGSIDTSSSWAWRIGCSHSHFGYQNPVAAWILSTQGDFIPNSPTAQSDWQISLQRQLEFYKWLQSPEGAIAGGATNSWNGSYDPYPAGKSTFYDLAYDDHPVYHDPGSNTWFGWQAWSMERLCEYYFLTNDSLAKEVLDKWITWVKSEVRLLADGTYEIPVELSWEGEPDTWDPANPGDNSSLHVTIENYNQDVGIAACLAKALTYYAAGTYRWDTLDEDARDLAKELLDRMWASFRDDKGVSVTEERGDFNRFFDQEIYIPQGWQGQMANGDIIEPGVKFIDIRTQYMNDPMYQDLVDAYNAGVDFSANYHRTWAQIDIALANAEYGKFFIDGEIPDPENQLPIVSVTAPQNNSEYEEGDSITISADATDTDGTITLVEFYANGTKIGEDANAPYTITWDNVAQGQYAITAKATDDEEGYKTSNPVNIIVYGEGVEGDLKVQYRCMERSATANSIRAHFNILNTGITSVPMSELTMRYYYTLENPATQEFHCDYAQIGSSNVSANFVQIDGNEYYVEISFSSGAPSINANGQSGEIQTRWNKINWSVYAQSDDYSFDPDLTSFTEWKKVTLYRNGQLVWGIPYNEIPNEPPTVSITSPSEGDSFDEGDNIIINADADDTDGTVELVEFYVNGTKIGEDASAPYSITMSNAAAGDYALTAKATDDGNASTTSTAVNISVNPSDNEPPTVSITSPSEGDSFDEGDNIIISADADDIDGTVQLVEFYVNGAKIGEDAAAPYSITMSNAAAGDYTLTAKATDDDNASTTSTAINISVIGNLLPTVAIVTPSNGDTFDEGDNISITADASDPDGTIVLVEFYANGTKIGEDATAPYSITMSNAAAGDYALTAKATDDGSASSTSTAVNIEVIGEIPPSELKVQYRCMERSASTNGIRAHFNIINEGDELVPITDLEIRYYYTVENPTTQEFHCDYAQIGSSNVHGSFIQTDGNNYYVSITFSGGSGINANGQSGEIQTRWNKTNWSFYNQSDDYSFDPDITSFTDHMKVTLYRNDVKVWGTEPNETPNDPPTVSITSPSNGDSFIEGANITISASASDTDGTVELVEFYAGSTKIGEDATAPYSIIWSNAIAGDYTLTAKATDDDNASKTSTGVSITVNPSGNEPPTVSITSPSEGDSFDEGDNITISASASDTDGTVQLVEFYANGTKIGEDATTPYSITMSNAAADDYALTAKATDDDNASTTSAAVNITVEEQQQNIPPTVSITAPLNNAIFTEGDNITISASASDADGVIVKVEFYEGSNLLGTDTTSPYQYTWTNVDDNIYNLTAIAYDNENASTVSAGVNITVQPQGGPDFNYGEALQKAIWFYEAQQAGPLPDWNRVGWRGDATMSDGVLGGLYDAGDHVKFNLPMSYTASMLGWTLYEYGSAVENAAQKEELENNLNFILEYLANCWNGTTYVYQIGDGGADHSWWGPVEVIHKEANAGNRPTYSASSGLSAVMAQTAAALALGSKLLGNQAYLNKAKSLFAKADADRSDANYTAANGFYNSWSGPIDELMWAAIWLYIATDDSTYLTKAESYVALLNRQGQSTDIEYQWGHCWDDSHYGAMLMLAKLTNKSEYKDFVHLHLDWWKNGAKGFTPQGLAWLDVWGSLRYATTAAFLCFVYSDWANADPAKASDYRNFAVNQINYALGDNERNSSYVVGFGVNPPVHPHHRTAHGSWADSQSVPLYHRHTLYGALVGGPDQGGNYTDEISNFENNEVACDYNAGFIGSLAKMYAMYGGSPLGNFPIPETKEDEFFAEAGINSSGSNYTEVKVLTNNRSAWPARLIEDLSFRYYIDISEVIAAGYSASDITVSTNYKEFPVTVSNLIHDLGNIYYIEVRFNDGTNIYPGGQSEYSGEVQLRISAPSGTSFWDPSNDWSYQGLTNTVVKTNYVPVYDGTTLLYGVEP